MKTFKDILDEHLAKNNETWEDVEHIVIDGNDLVRPSENDSGSLFTMFVENIAFTMWTSKFVYFPVEHYHNCDILSIPRNPDNEKRLISF